MLKLPDTTINYCVFSISDMEEMANKLLDKYKLYCSQNPYYAQECEMARLSISIHITSAKHANKTTVIVPYKKAHEWKSLL